MPIAGVFDDEWRDCLRAHYTYVVRMDDRLTEKSLRGVMIEAGFTDAELRELTVRATMRVDDVGADFVPDMDVLSAESSVETFVIPAVPPEVTEIEAVMVEEAAMLDDTTAEAIAADLDETTAAEDQEEVTQDDLTQDEDVTQDDEPTDDPDVTQLSLF